MDPMNQAVKIGSRKVLSFEKIKISFLSNLIHLHEIHVVQSNVVELRVLYDGGGARVVGGVDEGQHLVTVA